MEGVSLWIDLPSIQSIVIGAESMKGYTQSSLYIQNCPELRYIIIGAGACQFISRILIKGRLMDDLVMMSRCTKVECFSMGRECIW